MTLLPNLVGKVSEGNRISKYYLVVPATPLLLQQEDLPLGFKILPVEIHKIKMLLLPFRTLCCKPEGGR